MAFDLEDFKANIKYGIARPNRYKISIIGSGIGDSIPEEVMMMAEEASIPGKSFATRVMGLYGPAINFPYQEIYTNLQITFICSSDFWERYWFEAWQQQIVNPKSGYFGYLKNYVRKIIINQLDQEDKITYTIIVEDAWPLTIDNQNLSYKSQNDYHKLSVAFAYRRALREDVYILSSGDSGIGKDLTPTRSTAGPVPPSNLPTPGPVIVPGPTTIPAP